MMTYPLLQPSYYRSLFLAVLEFVRNPQYSAIATTPTSEKIRDTFGLFVVKLLLFVAIAVSMALLSPVFDPQNISANNLTARLTPAMLFFVAVLALPLLEEIGFRLSLKFKPSYLAMSLAVIGYYFLTKVVYGTSNSTIDDSFLTRAGLSIAVGMALFPVLQTRTVSNALSGFWEKNFRWIFYFSCGSFALVHLFNYELSAINLILMPLITLPQIVGGVIYSYARMVLGFQYALLAHAINNSLFVLASMLPEGDWVF
jgi:hypothetical protein